MARIEVYRFILEGGLDTEILKRLDKSRAEEEEKRGKIRSGIANAESLHDFAKLLEAENLGL